MRIAITGAGGDIGARLLIGFHRAGIPSVGFARHLSPRLSKFSNLALQKTDLTDPFELQKQLVGCDVVIHTALDQHDVAFPAVAVERNCKMLASLLQAARVAGVRRIIHLSSIVALPPRITPEAIANNVFSTESDWYSRAKVASERWLNENNAGLEVCIVRPGLVYGPGMKWASTAYRRVQNGSIVLPDGHDAPCYAVHVDDLCSLLGTIASHPGPPPKLVYGINPELVTWSDFYDRFASQLTPNRSTTTRSSIREITKALAPASQSSLREFASWLWHCPALCPLRNAMATRRKRRSAWRPKTVSDQSTTMETVQFWPTRFELEAYLSTHRFGLEETGASLGFHYQQPFQTGMNETLSWVQGALPAHFSIP